MTTAPERTPAPAPDPLAEPRPSFTNEGAATVLSHLYGVSGALSPLHGERDLNFKVDAADGRRLVLKLHNPVDSAAVVEMRTLAIAHARRVDPSLPLPEVVPTVAGAAAEPVTAPDGRVSEVQLFTFLEGRHAKL